jgi:hypothetical protein
MFSIEVHLLFLLSRVVYIEIWVFEYFYIFNKEVYFFRFTTSVQIVGGIRIEVFLYIYYKSLFIVFTTPLKIVGGIAIGAFLYP